MAKAARFIDAVPDYIWDGESIPVPIEKIADSHLNLLVRLVEDMSSAPGLPAESASKQISGLLRVDAGEIWVNAHEARQWPRRKRYTVAHEIGHWVLHRDGSEIHCRGEDIQPEAMVPWMHGRDIEGEANVFGGVLLMPPRLVRRVYDEVKGDLNEIADRFDMSPSAVNLRAARHYMYAAGRGPGG